MSKFNGMNDSKKLEGGCAEPKEQLVRDNTFDFKDNKMQYRIACAGEMPKLVAVELIEEVKGLSVAINTRNEWEIISRLVEVKELIEALEIQLDFREHISNKKTEMLRVHGSYWRGVVWDGVTR